MGKLTISMTIFNSYVKLPEGMNSLIHGLSRTHCLKYEKNHGPTSNHHHQASFVTPILTFEASQPYVCWTPLLAINHQGFRGARARAPVSVPSRRVAGRRTGTPWRNATECASSEYWSGFLGWLVVTGTMEWIMTFHSVGNGKSSQLTNSIIFQRARAQPPTRNVW